MKKRSMLAIASLAAGFVVAAVTPSHSLESDALGSLDVQDTLSTLDKTISEGSLATDDTLRKTDGKPRMTKDKPRMTKGKPRKQQS